MSPLCLSRSSFLRQCCMSMSGTLHITRRFLSTSSAPVVNYYKRLGVESSANAEELKAAYRQRALVCHPDVVDGTQKARAEGEFRAISEAYDVLMDPQRRAEHDRALGIHHTTSQKKKSDEQKPFTPSPSSFERTASANRRKSFVRGDADRKFREAFDGMSLDQLLFQERLRQLQKQRGQQDTNSTTSSPAGHEELFLRVVADAAGRYAEKLRRQYGPGMLRHVKVRSGFPRVPQPPPSDYMPFRPFHGCSAPNGVRTPPEPKMGRTSHVGEEQVEFCEGPPLTTRRHLPKGFPLVRTLSDSVLEKSDALRYIERERNAPYNMGKLYSYHRPY